MLKNKVTKGAQLLRRIARPSVWVEGIAKTIGAILSKASKISRRSSRFSHKTLHWLVLAGHLGAAIHATDIIVHTSHNLSTTLNRITNASASSPVA